MNVENSYDFLSGIIIATSMSVRLSYEPRREKTGLRGVRPGLTQTGLYSYRSRL